MAFSWLGRCHRDVRRRVRLVLRRSRTVQLHAILTGHRRSSLKNSSFPSAPPRHPSSSSPIAEKVFLCSPTYVVASSTSTNCTSVRSLCSWLVTGLFSFSFPLFSSKFWVYSFIGYIALLMMKHVETAIKSNRSNQCCVWLWMIVMWNCCALLQTIYSVHLHRNQCNC